MFAAKFALAPACATLSPLPSVQTVTVAGTTGTFTLTFNGQTTATTTPLTLVSAKGAVVDNAAVLLQDALNALSNIGGVGGSVSVMQAGNVFTVTFGGTLAAKVQQQLIPASADPNSSFKNGKVTFVATANYDPATGKITFTGAGVTPSVDVATF